MCNRLCNSPGQTSPALLLVVLGGLLWPGVAVRAAAGETPAESQQYNRADAETIRSEVQDILNDPHYAPKKGFMQWLREKTSGWRGPDTRSSSIWAVILFWLFTLWCVLALLAILGHFVWTVFMLLRGRAGKNRARLRQPHFAAAAERSYEDLCRQMRRLAQEGNFREAIGIMMVAMLRQLDDIGALRFHESKTNGDYVKEYSPAFTGRENFGQFVLAFDATAYGGRPCERRTYRDLNLVFEQIRDNAGKKP